MRGSDTLRMLPKPAASAVAPPDAARRSRDYNDLIFELHQVYRAFPGRRRTVTNSRAPQGTVTAPLATAYSPPVSRSIRSVRTPATMPLSGSLILAVAG